ncbi:alkene reductase [Fictibacillus norfolkensis]
MKMEFPYKSLFEPIQIGTWNLRNRITMAPMTRCFAEDESGVVDQDIVEYYRAKAADGISLIITEGITVSSRAKGTFNLPGLYTNDQVVSWKKVTDAVHEEGGTIIAQLWHVGRLTHRDLIGGFAPQAPSAIRANGHVHRYGKPFDQPEAMSVVDIKKVIQSFKLCAENAVRAGFDGVEVHGAHGYLIDQFNSDVTNTRSDIYGGSLSQRLTFMKEVLSAVIEVTGANRTSIRFSEHKDDIKEFQWSDKEEAIKTFIEAFNEVGVKILHPSVNQYDKVIMNERTFHQLVRKHWDGLIIGVGNLNPELADNAIKENTINLAAFGRLILANPNFVYKLKKGIKLESYDSKKHLSKLFYNS